MKKLQEIKDTPDYGHVRLYTKEVEVIIRSLDENDKPVEHRHVLTPLTPHDLVIMQRRPVKFVPKNKKQMKARPYDFFLYDLSLIVKSSKMSRWK
jgi:hypothetical protein